MRCCYIISPSCGRLILYDFAGQYEHYSSSHAAILENEKGDIVFIVVDISKSKEQLVQELLYWNSFVSNQYHQEMQKQSIVVIGSHFDVAKSQGKEILSQALCTFSHLSLSIVLDCIRKSSQGLTQICDHISSHSKICHQNFSVSAQAHFLNRLIQQTFKERVACQFQEISTVIEHENNTILRKNGLLPTDESSLSQQLSKLSKHGHIQYFLDSKNISHSWIVLKKEILLSELNGSIFAPKEFQSVHKDLNSTGVVSLFEIKQAFPRYDERMLMDFMILLDFCHKIDKSEIAMIIGQPSEPESSQKVDSANSEMKDQLCDVETHQRNELGNLSSSLSCQMDCDQRSDSVNSSQSIKSTVNTGQSRKLTYQKQDSLETSTQKKNDTCLKEEFYSKQKINIPMQLK